MQTRGPSRTAVNTATWRAMHTLLDEEPKILTDPFARDFAGHASDEALIAAHDAHPIARVSWARALFPLRNRYAEDELAEAAARGVGQYVILGAGLDSFAYRRPDLMRVLRVFEVDHPASQAWKRARVAELGIEAPAGLRYAPIDFERETLPEGLRRAGVDPGAPVFFSLLGVTQYLSPEAMQRTLRDVAGFGAAGSALVLEFIAPAASLAPEEGALVEALAAGAAGLGEPWMCYFTADEMEQALRGAGFGSVAHLGPEAAYDRYLRGRTDGLRLPGYFHMAKATAGSIVLPVPNALPG